MALSFVDLDLNKSYTYADYSLWQFQERVELLKGKLFKMSPAPYAQHQRVSGYLYGTIWNHLKGHNCEVFHAPFDVRLPKQAAESTAENEIVTVVQPDICLVCDPAKIDKRGCLGAPDLVIEILSPGNTKLEVQEKYEVYQEAGVREYWLVNYTDKTVFIYLLNTTGSFIGQQPATTGQTIAPSFLPNLYINLTEAFAERHWPWHTYLARQAVCHCCYPCFIIRRIGYFCGMIIGNPLYDTVFKYLLQDVKAAKKFVGLIINEEIVDLQPNPQEYAREKTADEQIAAYTSKPAVAIYRLDFSATIRTADGGTKQVLIEVQKAQEPADIIRFRKYLGAQYQTAHTTHKGGTEDEPVLIEKDPLPIISIYILGFKVTEQPVPVIKANSQYTDVLYGQPVDAHIDFIAWLSHDVYVIQVPFLRQSLRTPLEQLLTVFDQSRAVHGKEYLLDFDVDFADEGLQYIAQRLKKVAASPELQELIDVEFYQTYNKKVWLHRMAESKKREAEAKKQIEAERKQKEEERRQKEEERRQKEEERRQKEAEQEKRKALEASMVHTLIDLGLDPAAIAEKTGLTIKAVQHIIGQ